MRKVKEVIALIANHVGQSPKLVPDCAEVGPYSTYGYATLNPEKASKLGIRLRDTKEVFEEIIAHEALLLHNTKV
ncbi:MAG: hypothetical protein ACRCTE_09035 [Cellulosilyticaceae bacterium]